MVGEVVGSGETSNASTCGSTAVVSQITLTRKLQPEFRTTRCRSSALRQSIFSEDGNGTVEAWISSLAQKQNEEIESILDHVLECMNLVCDLFGEIPSQMHESLVTPRPWPLWRPSLKPTLQCESPATP